MIKIWEKFAENNKGVFFSKEPFEKLCFEILQKHYPNKVVIRQDDLPDRLSEITDKLIVVFITKFYLDGLTSSRKGQIRNLFNEIAYYKRNYNLKIYAWAFCLPCELDDKDMQWWIEWKEKNRLDTAIPIELFDGNFIIELAKKYDLYENYFYFDIIRPKVVQTIQDEQQNTDKEKEIVEEPSYDNEEIKNNETEEEVAADEKKNFEKTVGNVNELDELKVLYNKLISIYEGLSKNQKFLVDNFVRFGHWQKIFNVNFRIPDNIDNPLDLFILARKIEEDNREYLNAAEIYWFLKDNEILKNRISENHLNFRYENCIKKSKVIINEVFGDIHFIQNDYISAYNYYNIAKDISYEVKDLLYKYYFCNAYYQLYVEKKYEEALSDFNKAEKINSKYKDALLIRRYKYLCQLYAKPSNLLRRILIALVENTIDVSESTYLKASKYVKRTFWAISGGLVMIVILFSLFSQFFGISYSSKNSTEPMSPLQQSQQVALKPYKLSEFTILKGEEALGKLNIDNLHLIDTALEYFVRATDYLNQDFREKLKTLFKLQRVIEKKNKIIEELQKLVDERKGIYFIDLKNDYQAFVLKKNVMGNKFEKLGFIDKSGKIIILPYYVNKGKLKLNKNGEIKVKLRYSNGRIVDTKIVLDEKSN